MALTTRQIALSNPSRATRQQIPPFLSKLYHMVNDPSTESLIRWSDTGDSFYVFDHERFAKEVLPHWFKHGNFGSFVRQLNNYGFHKVPHLQQGVLRSDGEAEISHFENRYFQRGQSDLLCFIQRKKQGHDAGEDPPEPVQPPSSSGPTNGTEPEQPVPNSPLPKGTVLDVNSIVNGIQAIKRHQHTISAELKELHQSNQGLWQEAYASRERHKKHHDTITRILKFLAGVFGQASNNAHAQEVPHDSSGDNGSIIQRRPNRLMIEDGVKKAVSTSTPKINLNDFMETLDFEGGQANDGDRFSAVEPVGSRGISPTPSIAKESTVMGDAPSPASPTTTNVTGISKVALSTPSTPNVTNKGDTNNTSNLLSYPFPTFTQNQSNINALPEIFSPSFTTTTASTPNPNPTTPKNHSTALACSTPPIPNIPGNDAYFTNALNVLMNNPAQLQRVFAALQMQMPMTIPPEPDGNSGVLSTGNNNGNTSMTSPGIPEFVPTPDSQLFDSGPTLSLLDGPSSMVLSYPIDDAASFNALGQAPQQPQKSYRDTADVEADVNMLQGHIDSLIESLGLDPDTRAALRGESIDEIVASNQNQNQNNHGHHVHHVNNPTLSTTAAPFSDANPDFDFDSFLTHDFDGSGGGFGLGQGFELSHAAQTNGSEKIGAFLDEVQSVSNESDITVPDGGGDVQQVSKDGGAGGARKRKSEATEMEATTVAVPRTKKKR